MQAPRNLPGRDDPSASLDERIRAAELRLIRREEDLKRRLGSLGRRLHDATQLPRRWLPAAGAAVAGAALWWLLRSRPRRGLARPAARPAASPWRPGPLVLAWLLDVGLPLLLRRLESRPRRPGGPP